MSIQPNPNLQNRLSEEHMKKAVQEIVFDLGIPPEQAREWAVEEQERLLKEDSIVTRELLVVKVDAHHLDDENVPAELVERKQEAEPFPGTELVKGIVKGVKKRYETLKN